MNLLDLALEHRLALAEVVDVDLEVLALEGDVGELGGDLLGGSTGGDDLGTLGKLVGDLLLPEQREVNLLESEQCGCL